MILNQFLSDKWKECDRVSTAKSRAEYTEALSCRNDRGVTQQSATCEEIQEYYLALLILHIRPLKFN